MTSERVLFLDLVGGAAGDMLLAALLDAGASESAVRQVVGALGLEGLELITRQVHPAGLRALQLDVVLRGQLADEGGGHAHLALPDRDRDHDHDHRDGHDGAHHDGHDHPDGHAHHDGDDDDLGHHGHAHPDPHDHHDDDDHHHHAGHRSYREVCRLLDAADLPDAVRARAHDAFGRLARAEAAAHGLAVEDVVFHEVGADDALVDIVGVCAAIEDLGAPRVVVSPIPLGSGLTRGAHGPIPLPGPATLHLLLGAPTIACGLEGETVTPTGAALIRTLAHEFGAAPNMVIERVGVGAGHRDWPDRPNVVRALIGQVYAATGLEASSDDCVIEANLDDMSPELLADLEGALFEAGAFDVWSAPVHMKKGRLGVVVSALTRRSLRDVVAGAFLSHSTTLGVRIVEVERLRAPRRMQTVQTEYGEVRVKRSPRPVGPELVAPEHDDCAERARAARVPVRAVYEAAMKAAWARDV